MGVQITLSNIHGDELVLGDFDAVAYDTDAIRCYQGGAMVKAIEVTTSATDGMPLFVTADENDLDCEFTHWRVESS